MSTRLDEDDDDLLLYVDAFREVEQPSPATAAATWSAIAGEVTPSRGRWVWAVIGASMAAAAAVTLVIVGPRIFDRSDAQRDAQQAGYGEVVEESETAVVERREGRRSRQQDVVAPEAGPTEGQAEDEDEVVVIEPDSEPEAVSSSSRSKKSKRTSPSATEAPVDEGAGLAEETALFGEIQSALVQGRTGAALSAIAKHERSFPNGVFRLERTVAKARALCSAGRKADAVKVRDNFLERHPKSHLAPRMREVCR